MVVELNDTFKVKDLFVWFNLLIGKPGLQKGKNDNSRL